MTAPLAAFTCTNEEDALMWGNQYLAEVERLGIPFYIHLDRCSLGVMRMFTTHPLCGGATHQPDMRIEYDEKHKQAVLDLLSSRGHAWALHWDMDEVWGKDAPAKLKAMVKLKADYCQVHWVNCWGDKGHIRVDTLFASSWRVKGYNLQDRRKWYFDHPQTYGCKMVGRDGKVLNGVGEKERLDLACVHMGLMTRELREMHKERWDRIYSTASRGDPNPYKFWDYCLNETDYPPEVVPNEYS